MLQKSKDGGVEDDNIRQKIMYPTCTCKVLEIPHKHLIKVIVA